MCSAVAPVLHNTPSSRLPPRRDEEEAARALQGMQGRYYAGKPIVVEFSPVTGERGLEEQLARLAERKG